MNRYVALLRSINVGGNNKVPMSVLAEMVSGLGVTEVRTLLQSGNVVFTASEGTAVEWERRLEAAAPRGLGSAIEFFVRSSHEWNRVIEGNPFPEEASADPGRLVVLFTKSTPRSGGLDALAHAIVGREVVRGSDGVVYAYYPDGQGNSKLTSAVIERHLGTRVTARNWNTVVKLVRLAVGG